MVPSVPTTLVAADFAGLFSSVGLPLLGLIVVVVIGWFAIVRIRSWMRDDEERTDAFTLDDLRRLRREGRISEEEFEKARQAMIGAVRAAPSAKRIVPPKVVAPPVKPGGLPSVERPPSAMPEDAKPIRIDANTVPPAVREDGVHPPKSPKRPPQLG